MHSNFRQILFGLIVLLCSIIPISAQVERDFETVVQSGAMAPRPREVFYLGRAERTFHKPVNFYEELRRPFAERGIKFTFFDQLSDLNLATLQLYDGLYMYGDVQTSTANSEVFGRPYVNAIVDYVEGGGGLIGMHVASACFRNSTTFAGLLGGRFTGHRPYQEFPTLLSETISHPIIESLETYTSLDEPYQINSLNPDITLLGTRDPVEKETTTWPVTWVREQGQGRVFYHAGGHNISTWDENNFRELMIRGSKWGAKAGSLDEHGNILRATISKSGVISYLSEVTTESGVEWGVFTNGVQSILSGRDLFDSTSAGVLANDPGTVFASAGPGLIAISSPVVRAGEAGPLAAFLFGPEQCPHLIAATGLLCPQAGPNIEYAEAKFSDFRASEAGVGLLKAAVKNPTLPLGNTVILRTNGLVTTKILMDGEAVPGGSALVSNCKVGLMDLSDSGIVAVTCQGVEDSVTKEYLLSDRAGGGLDILLDSDDTVTGLPAGVVVSGFEWMKMRDNGEVVFTARLEGPGVVAANDLAVCIFSIADELTVVLREGVELEGGTLSEGGESWEIAISDESLAAIVSINLSGGGSRREILKVEEDGLKTLVAEGSGIVEEGFTWGLTQFQAGSLACKGAQIVVGAEISSGMSQAESLLLLERVYPRILVRTGWELPVMAAGVSVNGFDFQGGGEARSGMSEENLVVVVGGSDGSSQLLEIGLGDSLDGDLFDDNAEIVFGGNPDQQDGGPPSGSLKVFYSTPFDDIHLSFWRNETLPGSSYQIQGSDDLVSWAEEAGAVPASDQSGVKLGFEKMTLILRLLQTSKFYRVVYEF
jgi:type 1 glutamine amidotransferase